MKFTYIYLSTLLLFILSCNTNQKNENTGSEEVNTKVNEVVKETIVIEETWDSTTVVGEAILWRKENIEGSGKWSSVHATNIFGFKEQVDIGAKIQIIPLTDQLSFIELKVIKVTPRDEMGDIWYSIDLEDIKDKSYFDFKAPDDRRGEFPLDLIVIYPPVKYCALIKIDDLDLTDLPSQVNKNTIKGALDFNSDGKPNAIISEFCCKNPTSTTNCDMICTETYIKSNNRWIMINSSQPM